MSRLRTLVRRAAGERGYTIPELLTTMSILLVVLAGVTSLFVAGSKAQADLTARFDVQTELRVGLDRMRREIHSACSASTTGSSVVLAMPSSTDGCITPTTRTWCTQGSGSRFGLYRIDNTSVCSGGVKYADFLTSGSVFTYLGPNDPSGSYSLARLHVDMTLDEHPENTSASYRVVDDIVFRNSGRT